MNLCCPVVFGAISCHKIVSVSMFDDWLSYQGLAYMVIEHFIVIELACPKKLAADGGDDLWLMPGEASSKRRDDYWAESKMLLETGQGSNIKFL